MGGIGVEVRAQAGGRQHGFLAEVLDQRQVERLLGAQQALDTVELIFVDLRRAGLEPGAQACAQRHAQTLGDGRLQVGDRSLGSR